MQFGYELEFMGANLSRLSKNLSIPYTNKEEDIRLNYHHFNLQNELGITLDGCGGELISPVYKREEKQKCYKELKEKLYILKQEKAYVPQKASKNKCGFHIHNSNEFENEKDPHFENLLLFIVTFQAEIYENAKGEGKSFRSTIDEYSRPIYDIDYFPTLLRQKQYCLRLSNQTIELRPFASSLKEKILMEYLEFNFHLMDYIYSDTFDKEQIWYYYLQTKKVNSAFYLHASKEKDQVMKRLLNLN